MRTKITALTTRTFLTTLFFIMLISMTAVMAFACDDQPQPIETVSVDSVADFVAENGIVNEKTVFTIEKDLVSDDFTTLYADKTSPVSGTIEGNNKTVELTIRNKDDLTIFSMFGYAKNLTVKNLTLNFTVEDSCKLATKKTILSSLVGNAIDNVTIDNVTVRFTASPGMTLREYYVGEETEPRYSSDNVVYIGGIVGISGGKVTISRSTIDFNVTQSDEAVNDAFGSTMYRKETFLGGVVATSAVSSDLTIDNVVVNDMTADVTSDNLTIGGFGAILNNATVTTSKVNSYAFSLGFYKKADIGGAVGTAYCTTLYDVGLYGDVIKLDALGSDNDKTVLTLGGIAGYFYSPATDDDGDVCSTANNITAAITANGSLVSSTDAKFSYGFAVLDNASYSSCAVSGSITDADKEGMTFGEYFADKR